MAATAPSGPPGPQSIKTKIGFNTPVYQHMLDNQKVLSQQIARLDSASLAAQAGEHAAQAAASAMAAKSKATLVSSAAELSAEVGAHARRGHGLNARAFARQRTPPVAMPALSRARDGHGCGLLVMCAARGHNCRWRTARMRRRCSTLPLNLAACTCAPPTWPPNAAVVPLRCGFRRSPC